MPARVLETVLTGRNLLSPVLTGAAADVTAFDAKVAASQEKASTSAQTSARAQVKASDQVVAANTRTAASSSEAAAKVTAANTRSAESSTAASGKVVAANARAAESSRVFGDVTESSAARAHAAWSTLATKGLPLVAAALVVVTGKMAGDYQQLVTKLETTAGETQANLGKVSQGMLDMAGQVGISATELARGMYTVESAGYHGAAALTVLKASAQGARQEQADLGKVTDAVSTILHDYHLPASQAATVTSQLVTAVSHGKTTFDELTGSLHSVTPLASVLHISLADVTGTLSAMTASGESADQATQNMADTLRHLANPTNTMIAEMAQLGISTNDLSASLSTRGLSGTLQYLEKVIVDHVDPATRKVLLPALNQSKSAAQDLQIMLSTMPAPLAKLSQGFLDGSVSLKDYRKATRDLGGSQAAMGSQFMSLVTSSRGFSNILKAGGPAAQVFEAALAKTVGTSAGLNVMLQTTGENAAATNGAIKDIGKSTADTSGNIKGWSEVQGNFNQKLSQAGAEAKTLAIEAGQHLLPILTGVVSWIGDTGLPAIGHLGSGIGDLVHWFQQLPGPVKTVTEVLAAMALANAIGLTAKLGSGLALLTGGMTRFAAATTASMGAVSAAYAAAASESRMASVVMGGSYAPMGRLSGSLAGLGAAAKTTALGGLSLLRSGAGGLISLLGGPWMVGIAAAAGILYLFNKRAQDHDKAVKAATDDVTKWYKAMSSEGGQAAVDGMNSIRSKQLDLAKSQAELNTLTKESGVDRGRAAGQTTELNSRTTELSLHIADLSKELKDGKEANDAYWNSLTPQGKLVATVAADEATLALAIQTHGTAGISVKNATLNYNAALDKQKELSGQLAAAEQTQIDKLNQLANIQLGSVSSALAATQSQSQLADAVAQYNKDAHDGQHSTKQLKDESNNLAQQAISTAQAIGKQVTDQMAANGTTDDGTMANKAILASLQEQAKHITGPGHDALVKAIDYLLKTTVASGNLQDASKKMGLDVVKTWDKNTEVVHGATDAQIADLKALGLKVTTLPDGNIMVNTDTHMARAGLDALINDYNNKVIRIMGPTGQHITSATGPSGTSTKNAAGGHFRGAGTGTSDSNLSWISDGEFIVKASQTAKHLPLLHAINDGVLPGYANGGRAGRLNMYETIPAELSAAGVAQAQAAIAAMAAQAAAMYSPAGAGVERWRGAVDEVLRLLGQSTALDNGVLSLMRMESGGNPNAINLTDSNARAGHPSQGLMQTIPSTFYAFAGPYAGRGITDGFANIYAGVNYGLHTYGPSLFATGGRHNAAGQYIGYKTGTPFVPNDGLAYLHRGERVVPAAQNFTPTGAPGYAAATGGRTVITVAPPQVTVQARVFLGTREITDIVRIEAATVIDHKLGQLADTIHYSGG